MYIMFAFVMMMFENKR